MELIRTFLILLNGDWAIIGVLSNGDDGLFIQKPRWKTGYTVDPQWQIYFSVNEVQSWSKHLMFEGLEQPCSCKLCGIGKAFYQNGGLTSVRKATKDGRFDLCQCEYVCAYQRRASCLSLNNL